jgi:cephalosporin hydroxylase
MWKLPEDLQLYEHLLWESKATAVIELGAAHGGSALWFRDRLKAMMRYHSPGKEPLVISVDQTIGFAWGNCSKIDPAYAYTMKFLRADVRDADLADQIRPFLREDDRVLVSEDSGHTYDTTYAALGSCSEFISPGGFFVVEDTWTSVREMWPDEPDDMQKGWLGMGCLEAVDAWLADNEGFTRRTEIEGWYGLTAFPGGWLQRKAAADRESEEAGCLS